MVNKSVSEMNNSFLRKISAVVTAIPLLALLSCNSISATSATSEQAAGNGMTAESATDKAAATVYVIQPGDILQVLVWKEKDLQTELAVRPDGGINFPLVGEILASGKTVEQLQKEISTKLSKYVPDPVVTVIVRQSAGYKIYVVGKVSRPGEFIATRNMDVMQALSLAGGPTPYASVNKIKILRRVNSELKSIPFKYSRVEKGEDLEQNIVLQGGDVVVVP